MAQDWIIMRKLDVLRKDPAILRMATIIGGQVLFASHKEEQVDRVIWGWYHVWSATDVAAGAAPYAQADIDHISRCEGFAAAALAVGWLATTDDGLVVSDPDGRYNGASAKSRACAALRQQRRRAHRNGEKRDVDRDATVTAGRDGTVTPPPLPLPACTARTSSPRNARAQQHAAPEVHACSDAQGGQDACCAADRRRTLRAMKLLQGSPISARAMAAVVQDVVAIETAGRDVLGFLTDLRDRAKRARNPGAYWRAAIREEAAGLEGAR
jgi:hypothetical protein